LKASVSLCVFRAPLQPWHPCTADGANVIVAWDDFNEHPSGYGWWSTMPITDKFAISGDNALVVNVDHEQRVRRICPYP
jgi:hypothetical protein